MLLSLRITNTQKVLRLLEDACRWHFGPLPIPASAAERDGDKVVG